MASSKASLVKPDEGVPTPSLTTSFETLGWSGLKQAVGRINEEADARLRFPTVLKEIDAMAKDAMISAALHRYTMMIGSRTWKVVAPKNASKKTQERAAVLNTMLDDMSNQTWGEFISEVSSFVKYGFSIHELVLYKRLKENGSRYNDGLVGIKGIPSRAQHSVAEWKFDENVRTLIGWKQSTTNLSNGYNIAKLGSEIDIPIKTRDGLYKTLLFSADSRNGNPEGRSPLLASWTPFKIKQIIVESEVTGLSRDLNGVPFVSVPAKIMAADASDADKALYQTIQNNGRNFHNNAQSLWMFPSDCDPDTKQRYYDFKLLEGQGSRGYATSDIIDRLNTEILIPLMADDMLLGAGSSNGSNALASSKDSKIAMAIEYRLGEIKRILDQHLVVTLYKANGWELNEELPTFEFSELDPDNSEEWSKMLQRAASVGLLEVDRDLLNLVSVRLGLPEKPADKPVDKESLTMAESKSGAGNQSPTANGTAKKPTGSDTSSNNTENKG